MDKVLTLIDEALETTMELRRGITWRTNAQQVKRVELPFAIKGLDDPVYREYQQVEDWRRGELANSLDYIETQARHLRDLESVLQSLLPRDVWIRHVWRDRVFAVGLTQDGVFMAHLLKFDWQIHELPALPKPTRNTRIMPEWERAMFTYFRERWIRSAY